MTYLGVDPGKQGGLAVLSGEGEILLLERVPYLEGVGVDDLALWNSLLPFASSGVAFLERVGPFPGGSARSTWNFARNFQSCFSVLTLLFGKPPTLVEPKDWLRSHGLVKKGSKDKPSLGWARSRWPDFPVPDHDGCTDSLAICEYGRLLTLGEEGPCR